MFYVYILSTWRVGRSRNKWPWTLTLTSQKLLVVTSGADAEHPCQISRKSNLYYSINRNERNERTNEPTNTPDHNSSIHYSYREQESTAVADKPARRLKSGSPVTQGQRKIAKIARSNPPHSHKSPSLGVTPWEFFDESYLAREWNHGAIRWWRNHDDIALSVLIHYRL